MKKLTVFILALMFSGVLALVSAVCLSIHDEDKIPHDAIYKINIVSEGALVGNGTGFAVAEHLLVTAAHVCLDAVDYDLYAHGHQLVIVNVDPYADLCLLITNEKLPSFLQIALVPPKVDDEVIASGYALGAPAQVVTRGTFIGDGMSPDGSNRYMSSLMVTFGNSGGPMLDSHMHVVGVIVSTLHKYNQVSFASTLEDLRDFLGY